MSNNGPVTEKGKIAQMQPAVKEPKKTEREKLRGMTRMEKVQYIWAYYKMYFIAGIIVLVVSGSLLNHLVLNPPPKTYLNVTFFGEYVFVDAIDILTSDMTEKIVPDPETHVVYAESYHVTDSDPEMSMGIMQKLMANIAVRELDLMITDKQMFDTFAGEELFTPLSEVLGAEFVDANRDIIYRVAPIGYDENNRPFFMEEDDYGIRLADNAYMRELGLDLSGWYIGVVSNSQRPEAVLEGLQLILGE